MKNKNDLLYLAYYGFIFTVLAVKAVQTVYAGSLFVHRSHQLKSINQEKQVLSEQTYDLTTKVSQANSLHSLLASDTLTGYSDITNPIVINDKALVALK